MRALSFDWGKPCRLTWFDLIDLSFDSSALSFECVKPRLLTWLLDRLIFLTVLTLDLFFDLSFSLG